MTRKNGMYDRFADMPGELRFTLDFWLCEEGSSDWRPARTCLDRAVNSVALVKVEGRGARALASRLKRGDKVRCAHGHRRFVARVVAQGPEVATLWLVAGDVLAPLFRLSLAIDPLAAPMPHLK